MNSQLKLRCFFTVDAEADPQLPGRILHLVTVRGGLPEWFSVRRTGTDALRISLELAGVDDAAAQLLTQKILRLPSVIEASRTWLRQRDQLAA